MKICDLTQFYSPLSGGVKRYVHEKIAYVQEGRSAEHVLIIPGKSDGVTRAEHSRVYSIRSPLVSRATQYRALVDLRALDDIIERERPDIIESADPYQVGWKALRLGRTHGVPVVAFYHSHFVEAYLRKIAQRLPGELSELAMRSARTYVRDFYNRFATTLVPSEGLSRVLQSWGVTNAHRVALGINADVFHPAEDDRVATRDSLGIEPHRLLLLYIGRLAPEKNTHTLFDAFWRLTRRSTRFHLLVIGDGQQREQLLELQRNVEHVTWIRYCTESAELGRLYRAADIFVHPGVEETFGLVAIEAQACGTPVIGIRGTNMDEVILHDQTDWAATNSADALADAIGRMSARDDLPEVGAGAARPVAERYAWRQVFDDLFSIYQEVVASYRKRAR